MRKLISFIVVLMICQSVYSQLTVQNGYTAQQLANFLAGSNVTVTNATISGTNIQSGLFNYTGTGFPLTSGIILCNGNIADCPGPNDNPATSTDNSGGGHPLLTAIAGTQTYDAVELSFDFEVQSDRIEFKYIFASEEYNEFVGSPFNDVFAFFISGPGISGEENIALVPNTSVPVAINNINQGSYWQYYNNNESAVYDVEYDGFTTVMTARKTGLIPCETYTLKLIIADASDGVYDAAVFLQEHSLIQGTVSVMANTFSTNDTALEGCVNASFTFQLDTIQTTDTYIHYGIGGLAVNGLDYVHIDTSLIIPAGQLEATIIISALSDGITEGVESIELYFEPAPCQPKDTVKLYISDYQTLQYSATPTDLSCFESDDGEIDFNISGGAAPYSIVLFDTATGLSNTYYSLPVSGLESGTYLVNILDGYGCHAEDVVSGGIFDADTTFLPDGNGQSYITSINISGFSPGQTLTDITQFQSVCLTMEHSFMGELEIELIAPDLSTITLKQSPGGSTTNLGEPVAWGPTDTHPTDSMPGVGYQYCFTANPTYGTMVSESHSYTYTYVTNAGNTESDKYIPAGSYQSFEPLTNLIGVTLNGLWTIKVTDNNPNNNGYIFNWSISLAADQSDSIITLSQPQPVIVTENSIVKPSCGTSSGSIDINVSGGNDPYTYLWSNLATTQDISSVPAGNYIVTVTDSVNCSYTQTISLPNSGTLSLSAIVAKQTCPGTNTGSINLTVFGGTQPYSFLWSNLATTEDISSLSPGSYSVQITDGAGCIGAGTYTVQSATQMIITGTVTNENCGDREGGVDISVAGGKIPYSFAWSNGKTTQDITDLQQGYYVVTVTDSNNCIKTANYNVINLVGNCIVDCDLNIASSFVQNEVCGNGAGSISIDVNTSNLPYSVIWSTGSQSQSISGLNAGTYTVTVTDALDCSTSSSYVVTNQTGTLAIPVFSVNNEVCSNASGKIDITPSGGVAPYSYLWSNGAFTQDINGLISGNYSITLTDGNGCSLVKTYTVQNNTGTLAIPYGNAMPSDCGQANGSIDILVSGGLMPYTYNWSNGSTNEDLLNLLPGDYTCTVTDKSGCAIVSQAYTVVNDAGTLAVNYVDVDNEVCGNDQGEIDIEVSGGVPPYTYLWSNAAITQDISGLSAGTYSVTVTDNVGCMTYKNSLSVINVSGALVLNNKTVINEICSNGLGSVQLDITGGTAPYSYKWNTYSVSQNLYNLNAGFYYCTITDAAGCTITVTANVQNEQGTLSVDNIVSYEEVCGDGTGSLNLIISGEKAPVNYLWSNGSITQDISGLHSGTYLVTITDANGCSTSGSAVVLNEAGGLEVDVLTISNENCNENDGYIDISVSGGVAPYTYLWSNASTAQDLQNTGAGVYSCTITDSLACKVWTGDITISNTPGELQIAGAVVTNEHCGNATGAIDITVTGGNQPYSFVWSNLAVTEDLTSLNSGNYTVTVTDADSCIIVKTYTVSSTYGTFQVTVNSVIDELCNGSNGAIDINVSGGTSPYFYIWSHGYGLQDPSNLINGNYYVTVSDISGCFMVKGPIVINDNPGIFILTSINSIDEICGDNGGAINVELSGGSAPITYSWSNGMTTKDISGLGIGVYSCTATDNNGCFITYSETVGNDNASLTLSDVQISGGTCGNEDGVIDITVSGGTLPYNVLWSTADTTQDVSGLASGDYTILLTDALGCSVSQTYNVGTSGDIGITSIEISDEICNNNAGEVTVTPSGGTAPYTYSWSSDVTPCCNYQLELYDAGGDGWMNAWVEVLINDENFGYYSVWSSQYSVSIPVCDQDSLKLIYYSGMGAESENSYLLLNSNGSEVFSDGPSPSDGVAFNNITNCHIGNVNSGTVSSLSQGNYNVIITDVNGCSATTDFYIDNIPGSLKIVSASIIDDSCGNSLGSINIELSGGFPPYTYLWSNNTFLQDITGVASGTYYVTITDAFGCSYTEDYDIENYTGGLDADSVLISNTYCGDSTGSIDITISGGVSPYTYLWSNGSTSEDISGVISGSYKVTITDAQNCKLIKTYTILNITNGLTVNANVVHEVCGNEDGKITLNISGGYSPYSILWNTGDTTDKIINLSAGSYYCQVTDITGCAENVQIILNNNNTNLYINTDEIVNEQCMWGNGSIYISVYSGEEPYTYNWSNGYWEEDLWFTPAGNYSVTVTDNNGCSGASTFVVGRDSYFEVSDTVVTDATCLTCADGAIDITIDFGVNPPSALTYYWSNDEITEDISNLTTGYYTVLISDEGYCSIEETYAVKYDTTHNIAANRKFEAILYPNPSSGIINIIYKLYTPDEVSCQIINALGEIVRYFEAEPMYNGNITVDMGDCVNGVYSIKLEAGGQQIIKRFVLIK